MKRLTLLETFISNTTYRVEINESLTKVGSKKFERRRTLKRFRLTFEMLLRIEIRHAEVFLTLVRSALDNLFLSNRLARNKIFMVTLICHNVVGESRRGQLTNIT